MAVPGGPVSFHKDIRPMIEARCLGCHVDGGSGPFPLDTWPAVESVAGLVVNAVMTRHMPPWLADSTDCTKIRGDQQRGSKGVTNDAPEGIIHIPPLGRWATFRLRGRNRSPQSCRCAPHMC